MWFLSDKDLHVLPNSPAMGSGATTPFAQPLKPGSYP